MIRIREPITTHGVYVEDNIQGTQAEALMKVAGSMTVEGVASAGGGGQIIGIGITMSEAATAGNLFIRAAINGSAVGVQHDAGIALGAAGAFFRITDADRFIPAAGGELGVMMQTVGITPATIDIVVVLCLVFNRGISVDE